MVQVDAAVGIDVDQRTCLVEEGRGERNAELHRGQRQAFLQDRAGGIEGTDFLAAAGVLAARFQLGGHLRQQVVLDGLVVMGDVALVLAVVVELAHLQRVLAQAAGHGVHDLLDGDHSLGPAETAVGGVRGGVGLATVAVDGGVTQEVGVVRVEHGAVDDRAGEVRRIAAIAGQVDLDAVQAAIVVEADVVFDVERVTLAGDLHVLHARQAHLRRTPGVVGDHRAQAGRRRGLGFLAAEAAAHAAHVDDDAVEGNPEDLSHQLLHFGGVLRRAIDDHAAVFAGHYRGNLRLQVEMLLAADVQRALQAMRRAGQRGGGIADAVLVAVEDEMALAQGLDHVEHRFQVFVLDDRRHGRLARGFQAVGGDRQDHLSDILHLAIGQQRVAGHHRADVELAGNVGGGEGDGDAGELVAGRHVEAGDAGVGALAQARIDVQLVGKLQAIVDVDRLAADVLGGAFVLDAAADSGGQLGAEQVGQLFLALVRLAMVRHRRSPGFRRRERAAPGSICAAGSARSAGDIPCSRGSR